MWIRVYEARSHENTNHETENQLNHRASIAANVTKKTDVLLVANQLFAMRKEKTESAYISKVLCLLKTIILEKSMYGKGKFTNL